MSGKSTPKPRLVLCPKCRRLLQESVDYDVYKCGGCGTTLQAKRRKSRAVNLESSAQETDAAPRNSLNPKPDDKQHSNGEKIVNHQENGLKEKITSSSSGECSLDGNDSRGQIENGECNKEQLVTSQENGSRAKASSSSSGECSLDGNGGKEQIENGECNGEKLVTSQENGLRGNKTNSSSAECSLDGNGGMVQIENGKCNGEQLVTSQENGLGAKATISSSGEFSLNGNGGSDQIENVECNGEQPVTSQESGLGAKATISFSGECSLNGNGGRDQIENGECNGEQPVIPQESGLKAKASSSFPGEFSLNGNGGRNQIKNGECSGDQLVASQENGLRAKAKISTPECSMNGNSGRGQIENGECNEEQLVISQENGLVAKATCSSSAECSSIGNGEKDQNENGECNGEHLRQFNLSDKELKIEMDIHKLLDMRKRTKSNNGCSDELNHFEDEASTELMAENSVEDANNTNLQLEREELRYGNVPFEGEGKQLIGVLNKEDVNDEKSALVGVKSEVDIARNDLEVVEESNNGNLLPEGAEQELISRLDREEVYIDKAALVGANSKVDINGSNKAGSEELNSDNLLSEVMEEKLNVCASDSEDPKHDQSTLVGAKSEVDITGNASTAKRSSTEEGSISCAYPCKLEEVTYSNQVSSKNIHHSFDSVRSVNTFDNKDVINHSSEISGALEELSKSTTTRSFHAYDGSISSNDGVDERFPSQYLNSFENACTVANGVSEGGSGKGKGLVNSMLYGGLEEQHQSYFPKGKFHVPKDNRGNQNEMLETIRHGHSHWMRTKKDEFPPRIYHHRSGSQSGYESGSTSNQTHDELYCSSSYLSPDSFEDPDQEKMKLLRMVYKLQDQLNRTSYVNGETNGSLSTGNHISAYQSHDLHERRFYHGLDYSRCDGRCSHGINWGQKHDFSQVPYLAEPTSSALHVDHPCFHCCPQEWQHSVELPPRALYQHEELCRYHPGHSCCSSHHSYPPSPQWFINSKLVARSHEAKSCDQLYMSPEVKKYYREKPSLTKRHYRPVAGGAPFVTCHKCLKLLQLPADFLLFKRVCHQLKCGACQEVLKFSLQNRSHIISYGPNAPGASSSDLDDQNKVIDDGSNPHSESHANYYHSPHAGHVSYSDDYGRCISKSYSSEGDPVSVTPLHPSRGTAYAKPTVSSSTFEPIIEKEKIASRGPSTSKAPEEIDELAANSSNMSSEMQARLQPKSSPLHQLMGYSSPSQVIRGVPSGKEHILDGANDPSHNS